jgi:uncharacterized protein YcfJ
MARPNQEINMTYKMIITGAMTAALLATTAAVQAQPRRHGNCLRFDKTTGTVAGAVAGGVLGSLIGGHGNHTAGTVIGAAGGGLAGHELANNRRKNCRG